MSDLAHALDGSSVLVVEDDPDTRELYARSLATLGAQVRSASSVDAAMAELSRWRPDAVLCDLHLPDSDGYALLARARATPSLRDLPMVAISGSHPTLERERALAAGFVEHLTKPSKLRDVVSALNRLIPRRAPA